MKNRYELKVVSDFNDGDYVTKITSVAEEDLESLKKLFSKIRSRKGHNWEERAEYLTEDEIEEVEEFIGYPPVDGADFHTITSATLTVKPQIIWKL